MTGDPIILRRLLTARRAWLDMRGKFPTRAVLGLRALAELHRYLALNGVEDPKRVGGMVIEPDPTMHEDAIEVVA